MPRTGSELREGEPLVQDRVVYVLQDAGRSDLVKIGKDSNWPLRYRQARSQTPRDISCLAVWRFQDAVSLNAAERASRSGLIKATTGNGNKEWFLASAADAVKHVCRALGRACDEEAGTPGRRSWENVPSWDAWRDTAGYKATKVRRRLWVGGEIGDRGAIGALKIVHSPYYDGFFTFKPTYACSRFRWLGWWQFPGVEVTDRDNRMVYDLWGRLVSTYGLGSDDLAVGWLRNSDGTARVDLSTLQNRLNHAGMVAGDPRAPKPLDAPERDPSNGGVKIPYGAVPPQDLIHRLS